MPPRLSKRQQRELEELQQLEGGQVAGEDPEDVHEGEEEETGKSTAPAASKFDLVNHQSDGNN